MDDVKRLDQLLKGIVSESFYETHSHDLVPGLNTNKHFTLENLKDFQLSSYNTTYPYPLLMRTGKIPSHDLITKLVEEKMQHFKKLEALKLRYKLRTKPDLKNIINTKKHVEVFVNFIEQLELDPDPFFDYGVYNWYYTGGDLTTCELPNNKYLLLYGTYGNDICELDAMTLDVDKKKKYVVTKNITRDIKNEHHNILEVISNQSTVLLRQKNKCSFINIDDYSTLSQHVEIKSEVPFISGDFITKGQNNDTFCSIDMEQVLKIWDLNRSKVNPKYELKLKRQFDNYGNWGQIKYINENTFIYVDRKVINIYDYREILIKKSLSNDNILHNSFEKCDKISCIGKSIFEHIIYVATLHGLFAIDLRYFTNNSKEDSNIIIKWVHQMKSTPLIIKTIRDNDNTEIVLLSSCNETSVFIVKNNNNSDTTSLITSFNLPFKVKNIRNTFNMVQKHGKCIDPINPLSDHLDKCISGLGLININGNISLITKNSVDDIFIQHLVENENTNFGKIEAMNSMEFWSEELNTNKSEPEYDLTYITNFDHLKLVFGCKNLKKLTPEELENEPMRQERLPKWQQSIDKLYKYTDALATTLLDVFELDRPNVDVESFSDTKSLIELKLDVSNWLNNVSNINDVTLDKDKNETTIIKDNEEENNNNNNTINNTQNTTVKTKKKKHIVGF